MIIEVNQETQKTPVEEFEDVSDDALAQYSNKKELMQEETQVADSVKKAKSKKSTGIVPFGSDKYVGHSVFGSSNLGNTCFFNSAMQCLNGTRNLVEAYIDNLERFGQYDKLLSSKLVFFRGKPAFLGNFSRIVFLL